MAEAAAITKGPGIGSRFSSAVGFGALQSQQLELLQALVLKHITDPALADITSGTDFTVTSLERGVPRYEHPHLVAALDVLLVYQRDRRAKSTLAVLGSRAAYRKGYRHDPRTRLIELLKRWLRSNAANATLTESDVRRMCSLCRDIMNHARLFRSRNPRSFMHTIAEVYQHMQVQLKEVLEKDRTCAELAARVLTLSRNLIADAISYLLSAATDAFHRELQWVKTTS
eukprot:NODE_15901_length_1023_cov_2.745536.p1 GENE.NODE_15901_length_1023_cov_2.745536~~NODE_15901_length_1023_cov_2.745536.p1  ORF type:complete len:228 (-),score=67.39 NODE_15901_length_1023_cov_2.745536:66-749(-)